MARLKPTAPLETGLTDWNAELAGYAKEAAASEPPTGGGHISTKGGRLTYQGKEIPGAKMNVVILDHAMVNQYFGRAYNPDDKNPPRCFAIGRVLVELAPHENAADPENSSCSGCPLNAFGSATVGRGKACKNTRRLLLVPEGELDNLATAELTTFSVSPTSLKQWSAYVDQLAGVLHKPPFAVVTEISVVADSKTLFRTEFRLQREITETKHLRALLDRKKQAEELLLRPYSKVEEAPAPATTAPRGRSKF